MSTVGRIPGQQKRQRHQSLFLMALGSVNMRDRFYKALGPWPIEGSKDIEQKERGGDYTNQCDTTKLGVVIDGEV